MTAIQASMETQPSGSCRRCTRWDGARCTHPRHVNADPERPCVLRRYRNEPVPEKERLEAGDRLRKKRDRIVWEVAKVDSEYAYLVHEGKKGRLEQTVALFVAERLWKRVDD